VTPECTRWAPAGVAAAGLGLVAWRLATGVAPRGFGGAEYARHVERLACEPAGGLVATLAANEGARQSALLHAIASALDPLTMGEPAAVQALGLGSLVLLAGCVGLLAARLLDDGRVGWMTSAAVVLLPPLHGAAARYDHDLPAAAVGWMALAALAVPRGAGVVAGGLVAGLGLTACGLLSWSTMPLVAVLALAVLVGHPARAGHRVAAAIVTAMVWLSTLNAWLATSSDSFSGMAEAFDADPPEAGFAALLASPLPDPARGFPVRLLETLGSEPIAPLAWYAVAAVAGLSPLLLAVAIPTLLAAREHDGRRAIVALLGGAAGACLLVGWGTAGADDRLLLPLLPVVGVVVAAGLATLPRSSAVRRGAVLASVGLLVCAEAALGPSGLHNRPLEVRAATETRPARVVRGVFAAGSVDGRGWSRADEERPRRGALRRAVWDRVNACSSQNVAVLTWVFDDHGEHDWWRVQGGLRARGGGPPVTVLQRQLWAGDSFWWEARNARDRLDQDDDEPGPPFSADEIAAAPSPDVIVLAIEGGEPPDLRPLEGGRWSTFERIEDPDGGLPVGIWRTEPCAVSGPG